MARFFNTAGPCRPELHYMLPPERRLPELRGLIDRQLYFVVHAPRQTGKTEKLAPDRAVPIDAGVIEAAKEELILRRDTHLDSLIERLREPRVRRVIEPIVAGETLSPDVLDDDLRFARDLGLVVTTPQGLAIANSIYREVIPRALTSVLEELPPLSRSSPVYLEIPQDILDSARLSLDQVRVELAVHLYEQGRLSIGKAHELAGLSLWEFRQLIGVRQIPSHFATEDLEQEVEMLRELGEP